MAATGLSKNMKSQYTGAALAPVLFVGHGSPLNLVEKNVYTDTWRRWGAAHPTPRAILSVSAHWMTDSTQFTLETPPQQIFDFYGFPQKLYQIKYEPEGAPWLADILPSLRDQTQSSEKWGLDHGTWAVLHHMYPQQNIPTVQLSLSRKLKPLEHLKVAQSLRVLRKHGVMVMGSGNIVHNLRQIDWNPEASAHEWARDFEKFVLELLANSNLSQEQKVERLFEHPALARSHPTIEHLLPLVYTIGSSEEHEVVHIEVEGIQNAAVSMASVSFGSVEL